MTNRSGSNKAVSIPRSFNRSAEAHVVDVLRGMENNMPVRRNPASTPVISWKRSIIAMLSRAAAARNVFV